MVSTCIYQTWCDHIISLDSLLCPLQGVLCNTKYSSFGSIKKMKQRLRSRLLKHTVPLFVLIEFLRTGHLIIHINISRKQRCIVLGMKCYLYCTWWQCYHYPKLIYCYFRELQWMVISRRYQKVGLLGFMYIIFAFNLFQLYPCKLFCYES